MWELLEQFWLRDFESDVAELNRALAKAGEASAGFESVAPSVLTGDPLALQPGNCLMVLGINPAWRNTSSFYANDIAPSLEAHRAGNFARYRSRRAAYFRGGPEFNGRHYTRLGSALRAAFTLEGMPPRDRAAAAKALFDRYILMADLVPWWSTNIGRMNLANLGSVPFYKDWQQILRTCIDDCRPQAIVVNTSGQAQRNAIELLLNVRLRAFSKSPRAYHARYRGTPLFVHPQLNQCREMTHKRYAALAEEWQRTISGNVALRFN